ncbi:hypothetical protein SAMN05443665_10407 [Actinomadura meyerae]|uniref:Uncharacterized protein n=1 Tax=Actinomadura meyerae TaxID=240840 RepID=A0A239NFQ2_9ACTN|nr:hypothetical protein [Actinomadura meyerae]SNT53234.1 hypothetical protein SAMN05443665_10407 [Actinomadura meyerae]
MSSDLDRHLDRVRRSMDDYDRQRRSRQRSDDLRRHWEENGYPGVGEIVICLIIFFTLVAILQSHH